MSGEKELHFGWRAVVPASSANLGCLFDCAGLALKLYLKAVFVPSDVPGLSLHHQPGTPDLAPDGPNLIVEAMRFVAAALEIPLPGGRVLVESEVPVGVGLGSSAAAIVAGLLLAVRYSGRSVSDEDLLRWAEKLEGHIDNAAAAYHGGLVMTLSQGMERPVCVKASFPKNIGLLVVTPKTMVISREARKALPGCYSRADVVHTLQRAALLAATCFSGKFELFPQLFDDRLHQPYRQQLVPGMARCLQLRAAGLLGCAISGSGSSVIAFTTGEEMRVAEELQRILGNKGVHAEATFTLADNNGAAVTRELIPLMERIGAVLQKLEKS